MSVFYLESSALFKRYRTEKGTDLVNSVFAGRTGSDVLVTSQLVIMEMESAAARGLKGRVLGRQAYGAMLRAFAEDLGDMLVLPLTGVAVVEAGHVARQWALRALDALHLASAVGVRRATQVQFVVVSADREILQASKLAGFDVLDPEDQDALAVLERLRA
ncbi:MAG: type II toxin-antitoxin system VapC family toxin [Chloroflexi bacterium]|nr:type II toxin-antitoxin system VapC family toxin [Chloroflexota bacterium]